LTDFQLSYHFSIVKVPLTKGEYTTLCFVCQIQPKNRRLTAWHRWRPPLAHWV